MPDHYFIAVGGRKFVVEVGDNFVTLSEHATGLRAAMRQVSREEWDAHTSPVSERKGKTDADDRG
jgi:hypothetical protein